jgi:Domain of unknown function (DUF1906)
LHWPRCDSNPGLPYTVHMKKFYTALLLIVGVLAVATLISARAPAPAAGSVALPASGHRSGSPAAYLGFDRNDYPGDGNLPVLRKSFAFAGYWLSNPPGARANSWQGKRTTVQRAGFGFLLLFNGRAYAELKGKPNPGAADGAAAARAAKAEGFPRGSVIFLDQEEGGRMLDEQKKYVFAWANAVQRAGFRAGVYCSGIEVAEPDGSVISTARDLHDSALGRGLIFWVANDACPPSPGCAFPKAPPPPAASGATFAEVWQFAQSPRRAQFTAACAASYNADQNCYPPGMDAAQKVHLDLNVARTADPSLARQ